MQTTLLKCLRYNAPLALSLAMAYCLFALTPFLFLHSHTAEHGSVIHAHVSATHHNFPSDHSHGHDHAHDEGISHFLDHATQYAQESDGDHFGVDSPRSA
jgi:hypothetical protein